MTRPLVFVRSVLSVFLFFPLLTVLLCFVALIFLFVFNSEIWINRTIRLWARTTCWLFGTQVVLIGAENMPAGGGIVLFNHKSFFDIFALYAVFPEMRFGAKIELFSIPIFGYTVRKLGTLPIARHNRDAAIKVLQQSYESARAGRKYALSPEGGRSTGQGLLPFKAGPFLFAIEAGVPLIPIVIAGAEEIWPKSALVPATKSWRSKVYLKVLPSVSSEGYHVETRDQLQKVVRDRMLAEFNFP